MSISKKIKKITTASLLCGTLHSTIVLADIGADVSQVPDALHANIAHMTESWDHRAFFGPNSVATKKKDDANLSLFADAGMGKGTRNGHPLDPGFRLDSKFISAGLKYRVTDNITLGAGVSRLFGDADYTDSESSFDFSGHVGSVFGTYKNLGGTAGINFQYGKINVSDFGTDFGAAPIILASETDAKLLALTAFLSQEVETGFGTFIPFLRGRISELRVDGFTENQAGGSNPSVIHADQKLVSNLADVGFRFDLQPIGLAGKLNLKPWIQAKYRHEFSDNSRGVSSHLQDNSANPVVFNTDKAFRSRFSLATGTKLDLNQHTSLALSYRQDFGKDTVLDHQFGAGLTVKF